MSRGKTGLISLALSESANWRGGYKTVFWFQLAIAILSVVTLPVWKRTRTEESAEENRTSASTLSLLKNPKLYMVGLVFFGSCAIEYTCGHWGSTFLVDAKGFSVDTAASIVTFYYVGIALGRFLSGLLAQNISVSIFPYYLAVFFIVMIGGVILLNRKKLKRRSIS